RDRARHLGARLRARARPRGIRGDARGASRGARGAQGMAGSLKGEMQVEKTTGTARYEVRGKVALLTLDNPPVNGMSHGVRAALLAGLDRALADPAIVAIVIAGAGKQFSGGEHPRIQHAEDARGTHAAHAHHGVRGESQAG